MGTVIFLTTGLAGMHAPLFLATCMFWPSSGSSCCFLKVSHLPLPQGLYTLALSGLLCPGICIIMLSSRLAILEILAVQHLLLLPLWFAFLCSVSVTLEYSVCFFAHYQCLFTGLKRGWLFIPQCGMYAELGWGYSVGWGLVKLDWIDDKHVTDREPQWHSHVSSTEAIPGVLKRECLLYPDF